jgi:hypothetical protein
MSSILRDITPHNPLKWNRTSEQNIQNINCLSMDYTITSSSDKFAYPELDDNHCGLFCVHSWSMIHNTSTAGCVYESFFCTKRTGPNLINILTLYMIPDTTPLSCRFSCLCYICLILGCLCIRWATCLSPGEAKRFLGHDGSADHITAHLLAFCGSSLFCVSLQSDGSSAWENH